MSTMAVTTFVTLTTARQVSVGGCFGGQEAGLLLDCGNSA